MLRGRISLNWALIALGCWNLQAAETSPARARIYLDEPGVYRVAFDALPPELKSKPVASAGVGLRNEGRPVELWLEDGGDGTFESGDWLEFIGLHLPGDAAYFHEFATANVYVLDLEDPAPARMRPARLESRVSQAAGFWSVERHLERDVLLMRFVSEPGTRELWYWHKLSHLARDRFELELDLEGLDFGSAGALELSIGLQGVSRPRVHRPGVADHRVEIFLNRRLVGDGDWNAEEALDLHLPPIAVETLAPGHQRLQVSLPLRRPDGPDADPIVDVALINSIELTYPHTGRLSANQTALRWRSATHDSTGAVLHRGARRSLVLYSASGGRAVEPPASQETAASTLACPEITSGEEVWAVLDGRLREPLRLEVDHPSQLLSTAQQADYLMISHASLIEEVEPLAAFHRSRGLEVALVDVEDIYDEFNHGILHPQAIRDFISHAYHRWQAPRPRFVLLVGDASWDTKNKTVEAKNYASWAWSPAHRARIVHGSRTPYAEGEDLNNRNLVPTWSVHSMQGHAASDNWFVTVADDDIYPDLAIGRFPVLESHEVTAIVSKTIRYAEDLDAGPWRKRALFITDENQAYQDQSDQLAVELETRGLESQAIYARPHESPNAAHRQALHSALTAGQLFVHFWGHGGRFIWRTGKPDLDNQLDLFSLEDLDSLPPSTKLPIVLSMTCYSAPFDHPNADSIGEKFLRLPGRGAVAVFGASWRNVPHRDYSLALFEELLDAPSIGEGLVRAKRRTAEPRELIELYNLLGDPALPLTGPNALRQPRAKQPS